MLTKFSKIHGSAVNGTNLYYAYFFATFILPVIHSFIVLLFQWEEGDFVMTDNLAVGHFASANSQKPRSEVGLRVLHRTSVKGPSKPAKRHIVQEL